MVAFRGVIEHDVENDLDSRPVQRFDHVAKLVHRSQRILPRAIGLDAAQRTKPVRSPNS